ncbi:ATP-binding cassette sub-family G member 1 [Orussus abietinus]|uniref:ATP-binding cassette sub-family G member 1 n=1 Tax=Orussus abietinus TaxID=222816 RepID=UPI0006268E6F|nr:ATP-binding cassette sub-family G member 1 [Orussus abietinus]XP_012285823.1 ATP-binding cassette sub-family G member 1 [Orussus abietinus]XP_012285824.1 ATP-binding cassette sub-family G member 1 [Orussus abietinus]
MYQRSVLLNLPKADSIDIEFTDIEYQVRVGYQNSKKTILHEINGCFKSGELTAIMGPSGAGKSSLLNILTGFQRNGFEGRVDYVGARAKHKWQDYKKSSCYILQEDQLYPLFTVNEAITMAADLKLGSSLNRKAKQMLIDEILENLDLLKSKDTRCDRLSGGQKKRLSIALELIDNPPVMFLDEPTTGLDSSASLQCISTLRSLAKGSRTIICTIHQPSAAIYEMFDHVYLLAEGRCVFQGSALNTVAYFSSHGFNCPKYHNPADFMIEVVSQEYGDFNDTLAVTARKKVWRSSTPTIKSEIFTNNGIRRYSDEAKATVLINAPSEFNKFWILLNRCFIQLYRDWTVTHLKLILHFLVGLLLGLLYVGTGSDGSKTVNNMGYLLVSVVYLCYTSMMPAILRFPSELPVLRKEHFNNWYSLSTYYVAFHVANLPVQMLFAAVYSSVSYFLSNQPMDRERFLMFLAMAILITFVAESIGLVLGTTVNPVNGTFLGAIGTAVMLAFAGFLALYNHMPIFMYYVSYLSYFRYAMEGMAQALYGFNREKLPCPAEVPYCHYRNPSTILVELSMNDAKFWMDMLILGVNMVVLRLVAYCTLKWKISKTA